MSLVPVASPAFTAIRAEAVAERQIQVGVVMRTTTKQKEMMKTIFAMTLALSLGAMAATAAEGENKPKPTVPPAGAPPAAAPRAIPEAFKKYDKNGDGKLDEAERKAMNDERRAEIMKKYDKNNDGKLDETERQAMMEDRRKERDELIKKRQAEGGPKPTVPKAPETK